jgi:hypothetical protein
MLAGTEEEFPSGSALTRSLRALLDSIIDYAGLFTPAALPMREAIRNYERYRDGEHAWMLGRFVVPAEKLGEVPIEIPVSVLVTGADFPDAEVIETQASSLADIGRIQRDGRTVYVEITNQALIEAIERHGFRAKIRTGGVTREAFPPIATLSAFIRECVRVKVPFKATAGLHHPLRCVRALTYEADSPIAAMNGFVNLFLAAALPQFAEKILAEDNPRAFAFDDGGAWWRDCRIPTEEIQRIRKSLAISFGSCSFEEPVAELKELGWL